MVSARQAIDLTAASSEMRHDAAPTDVGQVREQSTRVMRPRVALETVKQHDDRRIARCGRIEPIEVPEIAVDRLDALAT